jgi:hypothetical protein
VPLLLASSITGRSASALPTTIGAALKVTGAAGW